MGLGYGDQPQHHRQVPCFGNRVAVLFDAAKWIDVFLGSEVANGFRSILFEPKLKDSNVKISMRIFMSKLVEFTSFVPRIHEVKIMFKTDSWELLSQLSLMWLALVHFRSQICS